MATTPPNFLKVNWDTACDKLQGKIGLRVIVRDSEWMVRGTLRANKPFATYPFTEEVLALLIAVKFSFAIGISHFILEGDALQVVKLLGEGQDDWSDGGLFIRDARQVMHSFAQWSVSHVKREANATTHILAKQALFLQDDLCNLECIHDCVMHSVL